MFMVDWKPTWIKSIVSLVPLALGVLYYILGAITGLGIGISERTILIDAILLTLVIYVAWSLLQKSKILKINTLQTVTTPAVAKSWSGGGVGLGTTAI